MNAHRRFALAAAAPALENLGTIAVIVACGLWFGTGVDAESVSTTELLVLGFGTTAAVALHAGAQWWGAWRLGVRVRPHNGLRDAEVRAVLRRALPSVAQAGLIAAQVIGLLIVANRVPGGVVALQIALNFYFLAVALGATPVALSLLPRLSRLHADGSTRGFGDLLVSGWALGMFVTIPAATAYVVLAGPLSRAVSFGRMGTADGAAMIAAALMTLAAAVVAQGVFLIATYASYARKDTRTPLRSAILQAGCCFTVSAVAMTMHGKAVLVVLGAGYAAAVSLAAGHLATVLRLRIGARIGRLLPSAGKVCAGAAVMALPAWYAATRLEELIGQPAGARVAVLVSAGGGLLLFIAAQAVLRTEELAWLGSGLGRVAARGRHG